MLPDPVENRQKNSKFKSKPYTMKKFFFALALLVFAFGVRAEVILPSIFSNNMVLQQNAEVTIWGWGKPGEKIRITCSWDATKEHSLTVNSQSAWSMAIRTPAAGGPYKVTVQGYNKIEIDDVLIGEVWLGSGQSNMEWTPAMKIDHAEEERAKANFPEIRFFHVSAIASTSPQHHVVGKWVKCTPETMNNFSALLYFFGKEIHEKVKVPVGLINASWGGTPVEIWMPEYSVTGDRLIRENAALLKPVPWGPHEPGRAFNAMIYPLIPFRVKGVLWYQGEANTGNPNHYARTLSTLISTWRSLWGYDFPFYYAQIAPWAGYGADNVSGAIVRDQQRKVLDLVDHTGMVVLSDIGDLQDIHPRNKRDAGKRLSAWALYHDYNLKDIPFSGPLYKGYEIKKDKLIVFFNHAEDLVVKNGSLREFEIMDANGKWIQYLPKVSGSTLEIDMKTAGKVQGVRFGYRNDSNPNLFNEAGLPASCFEVMLNR